MTIGFALVVHTFYPSRHDSQRIASRCMVRLRPRSETTVSPSGEIEVLILTQLICAPSRDRSALPFSPSLCLSKQARTPACVSRGREVLRPRVTNLRRDPVLTNRAFLFSIDARPNRSSDCARSGGASERIARWDTSWERTGARDSIV